ncbi:hypothetical protein [Roseobacter sp. A03A-229]
MLLVMNVGLSTDVAQESYRVVFVCGDGRALSPMCASIFSALCKDDDIAVSASIDDPKDLYSAASKTCRAVGIRLTRQPRSKWHDKLSVEQDATTTICLTPGAQHVVLEATAQENFDVEYWPLSLPDWEDEGSFEKQDTAHNQLRDTIEHKIKERFGFEGNLLERAESLASSSASKTERSSESSLQSVLSTRSTEILLYLNSLSSLLDEKLSDLEKDKPNDPERLSEWDELVQFLKELRSIVEGLHQQVEAFIASPSLDAADEQKLQTTLSLYKQHFKTWPRENSGEVVDGSFRVALVGFCGVVGGLFGQPIAGAVIGTAIFGGQKIGKTIVEAIKSGNSL